MRIETLGQLADQSAFSELLALDPPPKEFGTRAGVDSLYSCASSLFRCYERLLATATTPQSQPNPPTDGVEWAQLALVLGSYYSHLLRLETTKGLPAGKLLRPGISIPTLKSVSGSIPDEADPLLAERVDALSILASFIGASLFLDVLSPPSLPEFGAMQLPRPLQALEALAHGELRILHTKTLHASRRPLSVLAGGFLGDLLERLEQHYEQLSNRYWDPDLRMGVFSLLDMQALSGIATRDSRLVTRYGRRLPKMFEQQLALLTQSLGFIVVQTKTGERTVDLLCISTDPIVSYTFLLEAKTTAGRYALPSKDDRALADYVLNVRSILTTLPPLRLVLLVGPEPARTVQGKVKALEAKIGVPVRYCPVGEMTGLRQSLPGPLPARVFLEEFQAAPHVVPVGFMAGAVTRVLAEHDAHRTFVESLLASRRAHTPPEES